MSTKKKPAAETKAAPPAKKQPILRTKNADGVPDGFPPDDAPTAEETAKAPATKPSGKAFKESTFKHAATVVGNTKDSELHDELNKAIKDQHYTSALAERAATCIDNEAATGNEWLIKDLRSI